MYSRQVLDHFRNPRNVGELANATARVEMTNPVCGDILHLAARVENGLIMEVRFMCIGCVPAMACGSLLTERLQGRRMDAVGEITEKSLAQELGGLPPASGHAAQLAVDALRALLTQLKK